MKFVATGGVNSRKARAFLDAGASAVSLGSAADDLDEIDAVLRVISEPGL
jgi:2-keto-3-deoxy-6-phosphogluconate aldolase